MARLGAIELAGKLKAEIRSSCYKKGDRLPSAAQVVERFGASPVTCLKAYKLLEAEGLVECVQGKGMFFRDEETTPGLKRVGLLSMDYGGSGQERDVAFGQFMTGAAAELRRNGCALSRFTKDDFYSSDAQDILAQLDALILTFGCVDPRTVPLLEAWGRPVVVLQHEKVLPYAFHQVIPDWRPGDRKAAELLLANGARRLTTAGGVCGTHTHRVDQFLAALLERPGGADVEVTKLELERLSADLGRLSGREMGERLLREDYPLEAIFCASDFLAFGILDVFLAKGLRPGADFRLVSCDNLEGGGLLPYEEALLTSVDLPRDAISTQAARLLLNLDRLGAGSTHILRVPCGIVERSTTQSV